MTDHIAQQFGNYRLVRHLGRGAFSDVYLSAAFFVRSAGALPEEHGGPGNLLLQSVCERIVPVSGMDIREAQKAAE